MKRVESILREKDIVKASAVFNVPVETLMQMNEQALLNVERIRAIVMRQDFLNYKKFIRKPENKGKFGEPEILAALVKEYRMPLAEVKDIVNKNHKKRMCFCRWCCTRITPAQAEKTGGLCPDCASDALPKYDLI
jgi:transcription initiation factor IIE alpha subunit